MEANPIEKSAYRCAFCKRGFSNAQALGGHMNIHRRDRAKLREFGRETDDNNTTSQDKPSSIEEKKNPSVKVELDLELRLGPEPEQEPYRQEQVQASEVVTKPFF